MWLLLVLSIFGYGFSLILSRKNTGLYGILLSPALGISVFTQITLVLAFVFGVGYTSIFLALAVTVVLSVLCFVKFRQKFSLQNFPIFFVVTTIFVVFFLAYIWLTQALTSSPLGLKTGGGGMYGDTALHTAYTSRLETGEFPIQNPLFAGKILVYPFANDLLSAILRISGLNYNLAFALPQILFLIGFLVLFYKILRRFTSNWGFVIALLVLLLGWGIGALFFLREWQLSDISFLQFLSRDYTDNSQYNLYFHNILTGLVLPERSFLPGLFLGLLAFRNFLEYFKSKSKKLLIINGIVLGALPFWHTHTFIFFVILSFIFALWLMKINFKKTLIDFSLMTMVAVVIAIPFLYLFFSNHQVGQFLHTSFGWQNKNENILFFWFKNSFLIIPLAVLGFWFIKRDWKIYFVPAFVIFIIANLIIFQPWDWDNIKLISWSFLFFTILIGYLLAKFMQKGMFVFSLVCVLVMTSIASGSLSLLLQLKNDYIIYDKSDIELADWAKKNSKIDEVFLIEPLPTHPVPGLSGRLVYLGYPGHLWVHGIDYGGREQQVNQILAGDFSRLNNLEVPINYIVTSSSDFSFALPSNIRVAYRNQKYIVYKL
ncbi:hypothetical protein A2164_04145 [Candidatus Curtissbacteria bacterium RBG_13_35_7]|uniref:Glycosyltransferase RgtA/B/C/D-like domain-containing protein n=1 Tax=Candidatus Curtissbacteria bacterium RBG_13_35_7 TaxID=1797705 RepID=A0A1F5G152_9BACT|nr:MAG: hypothetical protein A2164_04145 [Candidatus Curtissbacteria bacterium RBG_13_35_7]